ncbi:bifunctional enoyl-CoA hydratase/phosphate acetyltransferase [Pseudomonas monteilii]|uniref:bifunctional enoyl-CoA hydratase/phosphate acetyltransferase n=1 Tax=Pseudomonas TaxID=286 RepID=UPI0015E2EDE2|nr:MULTISPECIES: bifunctional enoyl-CoA hydratase/phosphate acetyltransferase [Pseudomonas]ELS0924928.1 bifunctional enoyl-CoA hydratase/phosphate acetyltransferase [Pseudomonas putida]MBA1316164.1 bifunctional enoyl-CoA hydratase/phosphate acetyltransferase [Pseudomonas monteilii]QUN67050.1 bifunctional enoyl-CoA hydratase/phosphate acetyltransferase [Pseudomonas sp. JS425]
MNQDHFAGLLQRCDDLPARPTAVIHPCEAGALQGALEAARLGLIEPILVGPRNRIEATATAAGLDLGGIPVEDVPHSHAAAERGVALVREGRAEMLMKGSLHSDELLHAVLARDSGLRTDRRLGHVFAMNVPSYHKPLFITDAAVNILPNLYEKADLCRNAIDLLHALGIERPKVALISAVETITPQLTSTLDAAALVLMSLRGQINGALLDGPLAFDNAISAQAAQTKGIRSEVSGDPDILLVPNMEAGNILAKQLIYLSAAEAAGLVLGAQVPIVFTSRSDSPRSRIASCALALLLASTQSGAST